MNKSSLNFSIAETATEVKSTETEQENFAKNTHINADIKH